MAKLAGLLAAAVVPGLLFFAAPAQACNEHCRMRRGVRVAVPPFGMEVNWPRGHIVIRGPIIGYGIVADDDAEPPPPPEPPQPPPPPEPMVYAPPREAMVYRAPRPREPSIGVGMRASALRIGRSGPEAAGYGALLRFRVRPVELELEVGRDEYRDDMPRSDTRLGMSLYVPLVQGTFMPFLVAGTGMNFSHFEDTGADLHQGYLAGGGGLALRLGSRFVIGVDARYMIRRFFDDDDKIAMQALYSTRDNPTGNGDEAVEVRVNGLIYF